jgi:hypothetical protein
MFSMPELTLVNRIDASIRFVAIEDDPDWLQDRGQKDN